MAVMRTVEDKVQSAMTTAAAKVRLGEQLGDGMVRKSWTITDVSDATGVPEPRVQDLLDGAGAPSVSDLVKIAHAVGLRVVAGRDPAHAGVGVVVVTGAGGA
jgi:DNA-binding phage protein